MFGWQYSHSRFVTHSNSDSAHLCNRSKNLRIIHSIGLYEAFCPLTWPYTFQLSYQPYVFQRRIRSHVPSFATTLSSFSTDVSILDEINFLIILWDKNRRNDYDKDSIGRRLLYEIKLEVECHYKFLTSFLIAIRI